MADPEPVHLLTAIEASQALRCDDSDTTMLGLLPLIDKYIERATGRDWTQDSTIDDTAKSAARMLLVQWFENPAMYASGFTSLDHGLSAVLGQLEAEALKYRKYEFAGRDGAGSIGLPGARIGDDVIKLIGVYGDEHDASDDFEDEISEINQIQQISASDLSENRYVVILKSPADDVQP
jgi:hypothetical protein